MTDDTDSSDPGSADVPNEDVKALLNRFFSKISVEDSMRRMLRALEARSKYGEFAEVVVPVSLEQERKKLEMLIQNAEESEFPIGTDTRRGMLKVAMGHLELAEDAHRRDDGRMVQEHVRNMQHCIDVADTAIGIKKPGFRDPDTDLFGWLQDAQPRSSPVGLTFYLDYIRGRRGGRQP